MKAIFCGILILLQLHIPALSQESPADRISRIALELDLRLSQHGKLALPPIIYKPDLAANARYENDSIWIGQIQSDFVTDDDWMSIIYHEYWHYVHEGEFELGRDSLGQILQWDTDQWYTYMPSEYRIERTMRQYEVSLTEENLTFANRERLLAEMRNTLSQAQELPFIYAPSNLSLEEIKAYEAQLAAVDWGLFDLSTAARNAISERVSQQNDTYQRRKTYEEQAGLGADGRPIDKP